MTPLCPHCKSKLVSDFDPEQGPFWKCEDCLHCSSARAGDCGEESAVTWTFELSTKTFFYPNGVVAGSSEDRLPEGTYKICFISQSGLCLENLDSRKVETIKVPLAVVTAILNSIWHNIQVVERITPIVVTDNIGID